MAREQKLWRKAAVIGKLKAKYECQLREHWEKEFENYKYESFNQINKTRETFPELPEF